MFVRSASSLSAATGSIDLATGIDSPVSAASATCSDALSVRRQSAPTMSPSANSTRSPGTSPVLGTDSTRPSRTTRTWLAVRSRSASTARCALRSCQNPSSALAMTIAAITMASIGGSSVPSNHQASSDTTIAARRSPTSGSMNWSSSLRHWARGASSMSTFGPNSSSRASTSAALKPASRSAPISSATSEGVADQGAITGPSCSLRS